MASKERSGCEDGAEQRRNALRQFMQANGLRPGTWASMAGLQNANAIYNFLGGRSASLHQTTYERLAAVIPGCSVAQLTGERAAHKPTLSTTLTVRAEAAADVWKPTPELPVEEQVTAAFPDGALRLAGAFAVRVITSDMERVFPPGALVVCRPLSAGDDPPRNDAYVLVHARQGRRWEITLRQLRMERHVEWLWPCSKQPAFQAPQQVQAKPGPDRATRAVVAVVSGAYLPME